MNRNDIDLNAPAFGNGSQKLEDLKPKAEAVIEPSVEAEPKEEEKEQDVEPSVEENKVPYSRFKNVNEARRKAEENALNWQKRVEELEKPSQSESESEDMPSYWKELYGDSDASQRAWDIQQKREAEIERKAYEAGQRGAQELEQVQQERIDDNVALIDDGFEDLSALVGRPLSAKEQSSILDIVDEYTAKDEYGNYQGAVMPFDKAWDIYELKQQVSTSSTRKERDAVAALSSAPTNGETDIKAEQDKNWNPFEKSSWRKRL